MKITIRFATITFILFALIGALVFRVISLQVFEQNFLRNQGEARTVRVVSTPAYRGMILDRNKEPLAISTPVDSLWVNPKEFDHNHPQLLTLLTLLDMSLAQFSEKMNRNAGKEFVYLQRHLAPTKAEEIKALAMPGIHLKSEYRRYYPAGEVTAHVLGFTDVDDSGQEGLELVFNEWLTGVAGSKRVLRDRLHREVQILEGLKDMESGKDVMLSLDQRLQYLAYRELKAAVLEHKASSGSAVVLDVQTGEVLAMVNQPSYNPNLRIKPNIEGCYRNRAVTDMFEPGSVMKTFSVVSALQHGGVTPATLIDTSPGWMTVGGKVVKEIEDKNYGVINVGTILEKSSNVGITKITLNRPPEHLWEMYQRLGFGAPTGSGFPGETGGSLVRPSRFGSFVLATLSFGYGVSVTPLQIAQAYAILGSGGVKRPITFLKRDNIPAGESVLDVTVANQVVDMLVGVVKHGVGRKAQVIGYQTAGKTGTARKVNPAGGYHTDNHVATFAGLVPASHPRFAVVVVIDDPKEAQHYGGQIAAPVFSKIAAGALRLFNIPPDIVDRQNVWVAKFNDGTLHE